MKVRIGNRIVNMFARVQNVSHEEMALIDGFSGMTGYSGFAKILWVEKGFELKGGSKHYPGMQWVPFGRIQMFEDNEDAMSLLRKEEELWS